MWVHVLVKACENQTQWQRILQQRWPTGTRESDSDGEELRSLISMKLDSELAVLLLVT